MNKELKRLSKFIDQYYWKNDQRLLVDSMEVRDKENDFSLDIVLLNKIGKYEKYLFEIQTLNVFEEYHLTIYSYFRENVLNRRSLLWMSAHTPLYFNKVFTLKKFGNVTDDDIINCTKYFCSEVLYLWNIWNVSLKEQKWVTNKTT